MHKSPAMAKGPLGNVINRLVLKVDVHELRDQRTPSKVARATSVRGGEGLPRERVAEARVPREESTPASYR